MRSLYNVLLLFLSIIVLTALAAEAHPGAMAKDGCHKDNAAGERHYHVNGTAERAGECVKDDTGQTIRVLETPACPVCEPEVKIIETVKEVKSVDLQAFEDAHRRVLAGIRQALDSPPQVVKVEVPTPALKATTEQCRQLRTEFRQHYDRWGDRSEEVALAAINLGCW